MDGLAQVLEQVKLQDRGVDRRTLEEVVALALEIAREGREGRKIGTLFVVGDSENVIPRSRMLILDPLFGHPPQKKRIDDPNLRETVKELAQLDGAFIVSDEGVVISGARYINAAAHDEIELPLGLGSRHVAAASITRETRAIGVVVSESSIVRVFDDGDLITEILPELLMLSRYSTHLSWPYAEKSTGELRVLSKD